MKIVATYSDPYTAHIVQGMLESEGIMCEVMNENSVYRGLSGIIEGFDIRLMVNDEDYERAKSILAATESCE
ncbi:MAG: DUF2007 domain-containing protein [Bacteroidales bacterium]|nr:DUF2007 domain-containing protein [Bacteroidales bacterium]